MLTRRVTGCSWEVAARVTTGVSETTLRSRRTEWLAAGVFDKLLTEALAAYDRIIGLDLSEVAVDGSLHKAPCGGQGTGKNPTDRGKLGWKWSIATDRCGIPIGWTVAGANRHDSILLEPTLQDVLNRDLLADIGTLHLDRGYDAPATLKRATDLGVHDIQLRQETPARQADDEHEHEDGEEAHPRAALARRTHQLMVLQLRPATPQHRPPRGPPPRPDRPRRRPHPDRQTHEMGETMERMTPYPRAL